MKHDAQKIIVSGGDPDVTQLIGALRRKGFDVMHCLDGARTLEQILALNPVLVVVDTAVGPIPAGKLCQILRANPRTAGIAFCFIGKQGERIEGYRTHRDIFAARPCDVRGLLGRILAYLERQQEAARVGSEESDIEGKLQQVPLPDLLQIFTANRRDGILRLSDSSRRGEIHIHAGSVVNARIGGVEGEKAFFRLLRWERGHFRFVPNGAEQRVRITAPTEHLVMEGLRQADELAALGERLPEPEESVHLQTAIDDLPRGLRPATREVLLTLQYFRRVRDVLDNCRQSDLEILQVLGLLLDKGIVRRDGSVAAVPRKQEPLLSSAEVLAVKESLDERGGLLEEASAKMIVLADSAEQLGRFVQRLTGIREFSLDENFKMQSREMVLGDIGTLAVGETLSLRLVALPAGSGLGPLWYPLRRRLFGVVSLCTGDAGRQGEDFFQHSGSIPLVRFDNHDAGSREQGELRDRASLRHLLGFFAAFYADKPLSEESA